jgi:hypothetical protein
MPIWHKSKKNSITCAEVLKRREKDNSTLNNDYPENKLCIKLITALVSTSSGVD